MTDKDRPSSIASLSELDELRMISKQDLCELLGVSYPTIARWERDGHFPKRVQIGPNRVAWRLRDVRQWIEARMAERDQAVAQPDPETPVADTQADGNGDGVDVVTTANDDDARRPFITIREMSAKLNVSGLDLERLILGGRLPPVEYSGDGRRGWFHATLEAWEKRAA